MGNGQYYDPVTGRFLTRDAKPNNSNPYVPWDPTGALLGPLGLLALVYGRREKGSKAGMLLVLLLVGASVGMTLAACRLPAGEYRAVVTPTGTAVITFPDGTVVNITSTPGAPFDPLAVPCPTPAPTPTDDELRIQLHIDFETVDDFKNVVANEPEALTLARVAVAETTQGNFTEMQYIMWTIKIRAAIGFPNYQPNKSYAETALSPVSIKEVLLQNNQYSPIVAAFATPLNATNNDCKANLQRAFNPCDDDLSVLRSAYGEAQIIISQNIMDAPVPVRGYESFAARQDDPNNPPNPTPIPPSSCGYGDIPKAGITLPASHIAGGRTAFQDCVLGDNIWLWGAKIP